MGRLTAERAASLIIFCNTGKSALNDYLKLVDEYRALLADCPVDMLQEERAVLARLIQSERYCSAQKALEEIKTAYAGFHSLDIGCNVNGFGEVSAVSYTHLDVYKRQPYNGSDGMKPTPSPHPSLINVRFLLLYCNTAKLPWKAYTDRINGKNRILIVSR